MSLVIPDSFQDLLAIQVASLTTQGQDGFPQTSAVWFLNDDDGKLKVSLNVSRQKTKNLEKNPHATLFFIDPVNPYRTLEIRALVEIERDPDYIFASKVGAKYNADVRTFDPPGATRIVATFNPVKINTYGS